MCIFPCKRLHETRAGGQGQPGGGIHATSWREVCIAEYNSYKHFRRNDDYFVTSKLKSGPLFIAQRVNLELVVADYDRIGSSDPIGKVLLGHNRKGLELKHWKEMIENPRRPIVHWHVLKDPEPGDEECSSNIEIEA